MVVESNLLNALFTVICCVMPFGGLFVLIAILIYGSAKARLAYAKEISENLDNPTYIEKQLPVPRRYLPIFLTLSLIALCSQLLVIVIVLARYLEIPIAVNISHNTLGIIGGFVLLISILAVLATLIMKGFNSTK